MEEQEWLALTVIQPETYKTLQQLIWTVDLPVAQLIWSIMDTMNDKPPEQWDKSYSI